MSDKHKQPNKSYKILNKDKHMLNYEIIKRDEFYVNNGCHPKNSIIIVLSGSFKCTISEKKYIVEENDIFVFNKNSAFSRKVIIPIECIYLQFDIFPIPLADGLISIDDGMRLKSSVQYLKNSIKSSNDYLIHHFIEDIFIIINQHNTNDIVSECINYFNANLEKALNLDMLAEKFHISKQWLISQFKKYTNNTPMEYLNVLRIQHGKRLLANSNFTVSEIAEQCGFENVHYFSNSFKKRTNVSPIQYRKDFKL